jgi:hypothetical protein
MPIWPALIVAPSLALTHLSVAYALVTPACAAQHTGWLHGTSAVFLAASIAFTAMAFAESRRRARTLGPGSGPRADSDLRGARPYFMAQVAVSIGLLSSLVIVGIWIPQWLLSPCAG